MDDESVIILNRFRDGDEQAANELHARYVHRLVALARTRISQKLSQRVDAEDVVQSVYRSFFGNAAEDRYAIERSGDLWRLLSAITVNKVLRQAQHHTRKKRSINAEHCLELVNGQIAGVPIEYYAGEPDPADAFAMVEEVEEFMAGLETVQREIVELRLQGLPSNEIAESVGRSERTVRRTLEKVRELLLARFDQTQAGA